MTKERRLEKRLVRRPLNTRTYLHISSVCFEREQAAAGLPSAVRPLGAAVAEPEGVDGAVGLVLRGLGSGLDKFGEEVCSVERERVRDAFKLLRR